MKTRTFTFEVMWLILAALLIVMEAWVSQTRAGDLSVGDFSADAITITYGPMRVRPPPDLA